MPAKRRRTAASMQKLTSGTGRRRRTTGRSTRAKRSAGRGRARMAGESRQQQATGNRGLMAQASDMAQNVGQTTWKAARGIASGTRGAAVGVAKKTGEGATKVAGEVWENKWPALLIGAGATWWAIDAVRGESRGRRGQRRGGEREGNFAIDAVSAVADAGKAVGGRVAEFVRDNPVLAGAATVGVGVAMGLAMPPTSAENALIGDSREKVMRRAKDAARGTVRNVTESVTRLTGRSERG